MSIRCGKRERENQQEDKEGREREQAVSQSRVNALRHTRACVCEGGAFVRPTSMVLCSRMPSGPAGHSRSSTSKHLDTRYSESATGATITPVPAPACASCSWRTAADDKQAPVRPARRGAAANIVLTRQELARGVQGPPLAAQPSGGSTRRVGDVLRSLAALAPA